MTLVKDYGNGWQIFSRGSENPWEIYHDDRRVKMVWAWKEADAFVRARRSAPSRSRAPSRVPEYTRAEANRLRAGYAAQEREDMRQIAAEKKAGTFGKRPPSIAVASTREETLKRLAEHDRGLMAQWNNALAAVEQAHKSVARGDKDAAHVVAYASRQWAAISLPQGKLEEHKRVNAELAVLAKRAAALSLSPSRSRDVTFGQLNGLARRANLKASDFNPRELLRGTRVEMEHTRHVKVARQIAMDHLTEDPRYYQKLAKMERL